MLRTWQITGSFLYLLVQSRATPILLHPIWSKTNHLASLGGHGSYYRPLKESGIDLPASLLSAFTTNVHIVYHLVFLVWYVCAPKTLWEPYNTERVVQKNLLLLKREILLVVINNSTTALLSSFV